jgi:hypothetical protein
MTDTRGSASQLDTLSQANMKTISNIFDLMRQEGQLFTSLQGMDKTPEQKEEIINRINQLSELRLSLHENLRDIYAYYQSNVGAARTTLGQQLFAMGVIEAELDEAKRRLNDIQGKKQNKLRLVQLNTYYGRRYSAQKHMLITIVVVCAILFLIAFLRNRLGILPANVATLLMGITIASGLIYLSYKFIDFSNRDNMNFDEYNWKFDKSKAPTGEGADAKNPWGNYGIVCIGSQCCDTTSDYNSEKNKCIPKGLKDANKETTEDVKESSLYTGLSQFSLATADVVTRLPGNEVAPMDAMQEQFSNYASV